MKPRIFQLVLAVLAMGGGWTAFAGDFNASVPEDVVSGLKNLKQGQEKARLERELVRAGALVKTPPADVADAPKSAAEIMEASLSGKSDRTPGGSFFKRQCGWMEGDDKVRCMEHAFALDMRNDSKGAVYYEEDPVNKPFLRLTAAGKKFVLAGASDSTGTSGRKEPGLSAQDAAAACLREIGERDGAQKRIMAERALSVMRRSYEQGSADALKAMKSWGCGTDSLDDIDRCWLKKNCPEIQP